MSCHGCDEHSTIKELGVRRNSSFLGGGVRDDNEYTELV